jgi:hypothetical protein
MSVLGLRECIVRGIGLDCSVVRSGKQALKAACSRALEARNGWRFEASVDLDGALREKHPNENRWDYGLEVTGPGGKRSVEWVEFHPACSGEVDRMIKKKQWLEAQLARTKVCPRPAKKNLHWVATGGNHIDPARRRLLNQAGLAWPKRRLCLPLP